MTKKRVFFTVLLAFVMCFSFFLGCSNSITEYTIKFDANGGSAVAEVIVEEGKNISSEPISTKDGYTLQGWYINKDFTGDKITFPYMPTTSVTLYAKWEKIPVVNIEYSITFDVDGGSVVDDVKVKQNETITAEPISTKDGYWLQGWYSNKEFSGEKITFPYKPTANSTIYAKWKTPEKTSYNYIIGAYEFGPAIDKAVFEFEGTINKNDVKTDLITFSGETVGWGTPPVPYTKTVKKAYLSDSKGNEIATDSSKYIVFEFEIKCVAGAYGASVEEGGSPFTYNFATGANTWNDLSKQYTLAFNTDYVLKIDGKDYPITGFDYSDYFVPATESFKKDSFKYTDTKLNEEITLQRAAFETSAMKNDNTKNALIIWLHGAGEGGTDVDIALLGNDVTELTEDTIQKHFTKDGGEQGAYVLAVQTPTMWMHSSDGQTQHSGNKDSKYTDALWATIKDYVNNNSDVDTKRIYLGGCSNGGYMTMNMLFTGGVDYFAASYPVCQAYMDSSITDEMLDTLVNFPIWFTASADDTTVAPANFTNATYARLILKGAQNVHYSYFETVQGRDAEIKHMGHWSWIYTLQDRCVLDQDASKITSKDDVSAPSTQKVTVDGSDVTLWGWLATQSRA